MAGCSSGGMGSWRQIPRRAAQLLLGPTDGVLVDMPRNVQRSRLQSLFVKSVQVDTVRQCIFANVEVAHTIDRLVAQQTQGRNHLLVLRPIVVAPLPSDQVHVLLRLPSLTPEHRQREGSSATVRSRPPQQRLVPFDLPQAQDPVRLCVAAPPSE